MSEARDFIPTGNCVEQDAALFASPMNTELAKRACGSCVQRSYCQDQREIIGAILEQRGEIRPVVGGEVAMGAAVKLAQVVNFDEVTLKFDRRRLPEDGQRALRSIQQAFRAGQQSRLALTKMKKRPSFEVTAWVQDNLNQRDPDILSQLEAETRASIIWEIGRHILVHGAKRKPCGRILQSDCFAGLNAEIYYPFARAFAAEATAVAGLELPNPARLTTYHSTAFYVRYLSECKRQQLSHGYIMTGLKEGVLNPLPAALRRRAIQDKSNHRVKQQGRAERMKAASHIDPSVEEALSAEGPGAIAYVRHLLAYGVITLDTSGERPVARVGNYFAELASAEQAAILHACRLASFVPVMGTAEATRVALGVDSLESFVFGTLIPHFDPELFVRESQAADIRTEPILLLRVLRRELWANTLHTHAWRAGLDAVDQLLAAMPAASQRFWSRQRPHLNRLYITASRLLKRRELELDTTTFANLFELYQQDAQALVACEVKERNACRIALVYSPRNYQQFIDYATRSPHITKAYAREAISYVNGPLQKIRIFEKDLIALQKEPGLSFRHAELVALAKKGMTIAEARQLDTIRDDLTRKHPSQFGAVRRICVSYSGDAKRLEDILRAKLWATARFSKIHGQRIPRFRLSAMILKAKPGEEEQAVQAFYDQRDRIRAYFALHPHPDVDDFVIDEMSARKVDSKTWLVGYEARLAFFRDELATLEVPDSTLHILAATQTHYMTAAAKAYSGLRRKYEFDDYIESWMIDDAVGYSLKKTAQRLASLRQMLKSGGILSLDAQDSNHFSPHERIALRDHGAEEAIDSRYRLVQLLQKLDEYERAAIGTIFELDWLGVEDTEMESERLLEHFKVEDFEALKTYAEAHILPKLRG